jgi:hypothetical protein
MVDNIKVNLREIGCEIKTLMKVAESRVPKAQLVSVGVETSCSAANC